MVLRLRQAFFEIVVAVYLLCFSEWLFQVTKPSFMSVLTIEESLQVLLISPLYLLLPLLPLQIGLEILWHLAPGALKEQAVRPSTLLPAAVHAGTVLLLVDNFAYTVFGVGVIDLGGGTRYLFAGAWLAVFCVVVLMRSRGVRLGWRRPRSVLLRYRGAVALVGLTVLLAGVHLLATGPATALTVGGVRRDGALPDILFISMDGTEAAHTSVYGYGRPTTPFLDRLGRNSLVFENAFSNNCYTTGSLLSLLTGQRPTDVAVFYAPMTLRGADAYQHLPGVLRKLGYRTSQLTDDYWASALWQGMRGAFDQISGADARREELQLLPVAVADRFPSQRHFLIQTRTRVLERARHLLGLEDMPRHMDVVCNVTRKGALNDTRRVAKAIEFLQQGTGTPAFVQVHLMEGHCCHYFIPAKHRRFSRRDDKGVPPLGDRYDDAIAMMDAGIGKILSWLEREGRLDDTLIVVASDHTMEWETHGRIPLLIHFPHGEHRGRVSVNAQLADVAPTVLEYLGVPKPPWMTGESLLHSGRLDRLRPIVSASRVEGPPFPIPAPPLFGLLSASAIVCDRVHELLLATGQLTTTSVEGHTAPCEAREHPSPDAVKALLVEHLAARGFGLPAWASMPASGL